MPTLVERLAPYFDPEQGGQMIDQAWQPRIAEGTIRAYLVEDRVTGFGHQAVDALYPASPGNDAPPPSPRLHHGPEMPAFQELKQLLERSWIDLLCPRVGLARDQLPLLWDCDFMLGGAGLDAPGVPGHYALCEINVSSDSPFPPSSISPLVAAVKSRLTV